MICIKHTAAGKRKEFAWTDDEGEQILTHGERSGCNQFSLCVTRKAINHCLYKPPYPFKHSFSPFTRVFSLAPSLKSPLRSSDSSLRFGYAFSLFLCKQEIEMERKTFIFEFV